MMKTSRLLNDLPTSMVAGILDRAARAGWSDAIPMAGGEPRFPTPPEAFRALAEAEPDQLTKYSPFLGHADLRELIRLKLRDVNGIEVPAEQVICVPGGSSALLAALMAVLDPGDEVVVQNPCWEHYPRIITLAGGRVRRMPMVFDGARYEPDLDRLRTVVGPRTRAILLNTPLNPCGAVLRRAEAAGILEIATRNGTWVICDEEYEAFTFCGAEHFSPGSLDSRVITLQAFSKSFALTGIRLGYVAGPAQVIDLVRRYALYSHMFPPSPSQRMAAGVLSGDYRGYLADVRVHYEEKMLRLWRGLAGLGVDCPRPEGGVYLFPPLRLDPVRPAADVLIDDHHLLCVPGEAAGEQGEGRVRLFFGVADELIDQAVERIGAALRACPAEPAEAVAAPEPVAAA